MKHAVIERIMFPAVKSMYGIDFFTRKRKLNRSTNIEYLLAERRCDSRAQRSPITKENWEPMDPRKFGYDFSIRPEDHPYRR